MRNSWQKYKKKLGNTRPLDLLNPKIERAADEEAERRMSICETCPRLLKTTYQCKECGCFMKLKVKLEAAVCPLGKW